MEGDLYVVRRRRDDAADFRISDTENYGIGQYNTGINTADIYAGIPVFGIPVYRYWRP